VSHDRLLTASGHPEASVIAHLRLGDPAPFEAAGDCAATCPLTPGVESARRAREFTRITLGGWGMAAGIDVAELVVCELVTNALRHGLLSARWVPEEHPIALTLLRRDRYLMCAVTDPEPGGPVLMEPSASAESGRGLQVVASCSAAWGWQPIKDAGKVVWALLPAAELRRITDPRADDPPRCDSRLGEQVVELAVLGTTDERVDLSWCVDERRAVRVP
jgi:hypothetical protein